MGTAEDDELTMVYIIGVVGTIAVFVIVSYLWYVLSNARSCQTMHCSAKAGACQWHEWALGIGDNFYKRETHPNGTHKNRITKNFFVGYRCGDHNSDAQLSYEQAVAWKNDRDA